MAADTFAGENTLHGKESAVRSSVYEQGLVAGAIGAATIALWFFVVDLIGGRPLFTPSVLGAALFHGGSAISDPTHVPISFEMVVVFTWIHVLVFMIMGVAASLLLELAESNQNLGFGIVLLFVVFEFGFVAVSSLFAQSVLEALTLPKVLIGNVLAAGAMGAYFWRRHPSLVIAP